MDAIRAADAPARAKAEAETAFCAYAATFVAQPGRAPGGPLPRPVPEPDENVRLRGKSFLFTYNWDFFHVPLPDGSRHAASTDALWAEWMQWQSLKARTQGVIQSTSTMEESLASPTEHRVHFHWKVNLARPIDERGTRAWAFHGVRPNAQTTWDVDTPGAGRKKPRGANVAKASNRGHFYVWAPKKGSLHTESNYLPFRHYRVLGVWVDDLWSDAKLTHASYESLSAQVRVGHAARMRDLEAVRSAEAEARTDQRIREVNTALRKLRAPFRDFPQVTAWETTFLRLDFRWKILALVADSASGKSNFAESRFDTPFIVSVQDAAYLDLKAFDYETHDGLVLDNVNSWAQLRSWRAVLQARNAKSRGGQSATNVHSYVQYIFGVPIIATIDLDAPDPYLVDPQDTRHSRWLLANCVTFRLPPGEAFFNKAAVPQETVPNTFSLFAKTLKRRRELQ